MPEEFQEEDEEALLADRQNSEEAKKRRALKFGLPPVATMQQQKLLYGTGAGTPPESEAAFESPAPVEVAGASSGLKAVISSPKALGIDRLLNCLNAPPQELSIKVNKVGIQFPVVGIDLQPRSLLCLVAGEVKCDLPNTDDVVVTLPGGEQITVTFIGQWHRLPWLPFQIVLFCIPEEETTP